MRCIFLLCLLVSAGFSATLKGDKIERKIVAEKALHQARNPIDDVIRDALELVRQLMLNGTDSTPVLDPFFIEYLLVNFESQDADLLLQVDNTWVTHMAEFIIENISTNMVRLTMELALSLPNFNIDGHYAMDGMIMNLFPLYGSGNYYIHVFDVSLGGGAGLSVGVPPQIRDLHLDFTFQSLEVKFENLLGGGSLETVIETAINALAKDVVDAVWAIINEPFCQLIEDTINQALANMGGEGTDSPALADSKEVGNANAYLDEVLAELRQVLYQTPGVDPKTLPDAYTEISGGHAAIYNGWLIGLSSIHRSADATLDYAGRFITFNGSAGYTNMQAGYRVQVEVWGTGPDAEAFALIRSVDFFFSFKIDAITGAVTVNDFNIYNIGQIDIEINGLAPFDWAFESIAELIIKTIKDDLSQTISTVILELLRQVVEGNPPPPPPAAEILKIAF
ncbi:hypothetical protein DAPPUDRAFT_308200 [Daphnia pulex]|uniref:Uncharacterized protein n=1 Tax=Daphnia pulex TaxID=6669 RepID=E9H6P2_DAPPU|nr:hypothetical protein DAPPUDRAFT_308200 [Daphnia pulex]|eukprot:EFX72600.1 hypothetical protein DAPPUDRAFT_308200 [Daphnia pulex]